MKELLQLQNACVEIKDNTIFENVNLNVQQGDIIGIIGKNGWKIYVIAVTEQ
jgi:macrolide transport system ATP-binding/permease protein